MEKVNFEEMSDLSFNLSSKLMKALFESNLYNNKIITLDKNFEDFFDSFLGFLIKDENLNIKLKEKSLVFIVDKYCTILENTKSIYLVMNLNTETYTNGYKSDYDSIRNNLKFDLLHYNIINEAKVLLRRLIRVEEKHLQTNQNSNEETVTINKNKIR